MEAPCKSFLSSEDTLASDMNSERRFFCQECGYMSKRKSNLIKHIQIKHVGRKFYCPKCSYDTYYKGVLMNHMQVVHDGVKYNCHECNFETTSKNSLAKHIKGEHDIPFEKISNMADRMNLAKTITDRANKLFKTVHDGRNIKGRSNDAIAAACMYIACRQEGVPRTFKEIVAVSTVSKKEIGKCYNLILKAHNISVDLITTGDFMSRFCGTLCLASDVQKAATHIAKKSVEMDIVPRNYPNFVAAASIYMASQASHDKRTRREIADIAGVADVKIMQYYNLMLPMATELFASDFKFT